MSKQIADFTDLKKESVQEDIGYRRPAIPWSYEVMKNMNKPSPPESPLKLAWLAEKERQRNDNKV